MENFIIIAPRQSDYMIGHIVKARNDTKLSSSQYKLQYGIVVDLYDTNVLPFYDVIGLSSYVRSCLFDEYIKPVSYDEIEIAINSFRSQKITNILNDHEDDLTSKTISAIRNFISV